MKFPICFAVSLLLGAGHAFAASGDDSGLAQNAAASPPAWVVHLHTATFPDGQYRAEPGDIGAYAAQGPAFDEATFVKKSGLTGSSQIVVGSAISKFVARKAGQYQLGLRVEPDTAWCIEGLSLNGTSLIQRLAITDNQVVVMPVSLSPGLYGVTVDFGCTNGNSGQTDHGKVTLLVEKPGDLAPRHADPTDFVPPASGAEVAPDRPAQGVPVIQPSEPLPSDTPPHGS
jgi:hypothetical protein